MMAAWTEEPQQVEADYTESIPIGADQLSVQLHGPEGIYHNFTCSIYRNDTLFGSALTNLSGHALIQLGDGITEGPISLIISGYNILPHSYEIQVCDYWLGLNIDWNDPDNWFTHAVPDTSTHVIIPANPAGGYFPVKNKNNAHIRQCKSIYIEPGANFSIGYGETFSVGSN
jgi:hypothetical protein